MRLSAARTSSSGAVISSPSSRPQGYRGRGVLTSHSNSVIPAKAGIQGLRLRRLPWMPASAGMTGRNEDEHSHAVAPRSEEHTSELQSRRDLVCRLLLEKKKKK